MRRFITSLIGLVVFCVALQHLHADSPAETTQALADILKAHLPTGWTIAFDQEDSAIDLHRIEPANMISTAANGPPDEKPKISSYDIALRVRPFVSKGEYAKLKSENEITLKKLRALNLTLRRLPGVYYGMGDDLLTNSKDPSVVAKIDEYHRLQASQHSLPDFYFRNISLSWVEFYKEPVDEKVCGERELIENNINRVLTRYEP